MCKPGRGYPWPFLKPPSRALHSCVPCYILSLPLLQWMTSALWCEDKSEQLWAAPNMDMVQPLWCLYISASISVPMVMLRIVEHRVGGWVPAAILTALWRNSVRLLKNHFRFQRLFCFTHCWMFLSGTRVPLLSFLRSMDSLRHYSVFVVCMVHVLNKHLLVSVFFIWRIWPRSNSVVQSFVAYNNSHVTHFRIIKKTLTTKFRLTRKPL